MKRETKFFAFAVVVCALAGGIPWALGKKKEAERYELMNRKPNAATQKFRNAVKGATEVRVYDRVFDYYYAPNKPELAYLRQNPKLAFRDDNLKSLIRAIHLGGLSQKRNSGPPPGVPRLYQVLVFYRGTVFIGSLCCGDLVLQNPSLPFARVYDKNSWQGDGWLDKQSIQYLDDVLKDIR